MCGITGFIERSCQRDVDTLHAIGQTMADTLKHRGPDDAGTWVDEEAGVTLGHRRLSILDLSAAGRQPMASASGRYVIVYNGEVYNFRELRAELEHLGHRFHGHSDTEILLAAISQWDVTGALERVNGMFAFALWDRRERNLVLARDRVGKKPLYFGWSGPTFLFSSELKAFQAYPGFAPEIDRNALGLLVQYGWIPSPYSIFKGIRKLPAGTFLAVSSENPQENKSPRAYWSARKVMEQGEQNPFSGSFDEAANELEVLLSDAVEKRMIADVSLGALLSGGIDSTMIVSLMQSLSPRPVKTFSIGFVESKANEAEYAKQIAKHLGTDHTELYVSGADSLQIIPQLPTLYDEPFADPSQIPTFIVSRLARSEVTVALSGDGGDELFAGYNEYGRSLYHWNRVRHLPRSLRQSLAGLLSAVEYHGWNALQPIMSNPPGRFSGWRKIGARLAKKASRLRAESPIHLFSRLNARCDSGSEFVMGAEPASTPLTDAANWPNLSDPLQAMMYLNFVDYLADDILTKVDRASMAVSLEVRCPLLDQRIVEFAWRLPLAMRVDKTGGKRILKKVLERYVPRDLTERKKKGFGIPLADWLRGPLRGWTEGLLDPGRLAREGFFKADEVRRLWRQHLGGWRNHANLLWNIVMFQAWHEFWYNSNSPSAQKRP
jgi:asparagine synthase (glutamine-hydrolysing)